MGFAGTQPATKLTAAYDTKTQKLTLHAEGDVIEFTYGFNFEAGTTWQGSHYTLTGWSGPLSGKTQHYSYDQVVDIKLPSPYFPSNDVYILTANGDQVVPIEYDGETSASNDSGSLTMPSNKTPKGPPLPSSKCIESLLGMPFEVKQNVIVPEFGSVKMAFDPTYLSLQGADIDNKDVLWQFKSLQTGDTEIHVTISGGIATYVMTIVYRVRIFVLPETSTVSTNTTPKDGTGTGAILSFLGRTNIAARLVQAAYPDAKLYEVDATPNQRIGVSSPLQLAHLRVVFQATKDNVFGTAIIESTGWSDFGPVQWIPQPWLEDLVIPWPPATGDLMEPTAADAIMKKAGYTQDYFSMTLRKALYPGVTEPNYMFSMVSGQYVLVGAKDGKITMG